MSILAFIAYIVIVITASGTLRSPNKRDAAAWGFALLSTFALPWGGIPLTYYFSAGSWTWFPLAGISLCVLKSGGREHFRFRKFFAIANVMVIMIAVYAYMYANGIPGDIPGIEGVGTISSLEGISKKLTLVYLFFLISAIASFLPIYSHSEQAAAMLSFSYSSFLVIAFLPPARIFFPGIIPKTAIIIDAAAYFMWALLVHIFIMDTFSKQAASAWSYSYAAINTALTAAGICFLFTIA